MILIPAMTISCGISPSENLNNSEKPLISINPPNNPKDNQDQTNVENKNDHQDTNADNQSDKETNPNNDDLNNEKDTSNPIDNHTKNDDSDNSEKPKDPILSDPSIKNPSTIQPTPEPEMKDKSGLENVPEYFNPDLPKLPLKTEYTTPETSVINLYYKKSTSPEIHKFNNNNLLAIGREINQELNELIEYFKSDNASNKTIAKKYIFNLVYELPMLSFNPNNENAPFNIAEIATKQKEIIKNVISYIDNQIQNYDNNSLSKSLNIIFSLLNKGYYATDSLFVQALNQMFGVYDTANKVVIENDIFNELIERFYSDVKQNSSNYIVSNYPYGGFPDIIKTDKKIAFNVPNLNLNNYNPIQFLSSIKNELLNLVQTLELEGPDRMVDVEINTQIEFEINLHLVKSSLTTQQKEVLFAFLNSLKKTTSAFFNNQSSLTPKELESYNSELIKLIFHILSKFKVKKSN
ncbi:hypothetical protein H9M94_03375 [Mycoplasma sp. Pen4]|uniref:hypothetical protein n=1 Tax=Mycoplasma sp. Pen4 TaxID=640330 RepID=UPI0016541CEE|nr:hypothetical protein [Mycoplasma sp. Pen4]QNM93612.1 hypothetical protein H9M94_03375 [Mycoplasma sp. Pen4]